MGAEPVFDSSNDVLLVVFGLLRKGEQGCEVHKTGDDGITGSRIHPQDEVVLVSVAVRILYGGLCFADPTQAADGVCLCQGDCGGVRELVVQVGEELLAPGKEGIAAIGNT